MRELVLTDGEKSFTIFVIERDKQRLKADLFLCDMVSRKLGKDEDILDFLSGPYIIKDSGKEPAIVEGDAESGIPKVPRRKKRKISVCPDWVIEFIENQGREKEKLRRDFMEMQKEKKNNILKDLDSSLVSK